ncbi:MAG: DUF3187 family protein, partial [Armatimonadetes bacterium]|nr:DUF3187 family protein [Armatimonadota bacterium]
PSRFYGSGGWDWGLGLHLARTMAAFRLTFTAGHNWHAGWTGLASVPIRNTFDFHLGGEYRLARAWSFLGQVSRQEHALWEADRSSFGKPSYQIAAGFAYQRDPNLLLEGAFFENLTEDRNGFDVGLHYRMRWQL